MLKKKFNGFLFFVLLITLVVILVPAEQISDERIQNQSQKIMNAPSFVDLSYHPRFHNFSNQYAGVLLNTTFDIWNSGCCGLTYSLIEECSWVNVTPTYGHSYGEKDTITVLINTTGLSLGNHACEILIDSNDIDGQFIVKVNIIPPPNNPPTIPELTGPQSGKAGEEQDFSARSIDSDGDQLWYKWKWDDGNISKWIGPYDNNTECTQSYSWNEQGTYQVQVKVMDEHEAISDWSDPLPIEMPKNKVLHTHFYRLIQWINSLFF